uniref:Uncharacterized protein n=1 Tax=Anopheles minimus TaxID=112268 RepID=A0A182WPW6_9DIPT
MCNVQSKLQIVEAVLFVRVCVRLLRSEQMCSMCVVFIHGCILCKIVIPSNRDALVISDRLSFTRAV